MLLSIWIGRLLLNRCEYKFGVLVKQICSCSCLGVRKKLGVTISTPWFKYSKRTYETVVLLGPS
jgi:hypothetical protein